MWFQLGGNHDEPNKFVRHLINRQDADDLSGTSTRVCNRIVESTRALNFADSGRAFNRERAQRWSVFNRFKFGDDIQESERETITSSMHENLGFKGYARCCD